MEWTSGNFLMTIMVNWMLVFTRLVTFLQGAPFFGSDSIPKGLKAFIPAVVGGILVTQPDFRAVTQIPTLMLFVILMFKEMLVGIILAIFSQLVYLPPRMMGMMVGHSAGLGRGHAINPEEDDDSTIMEQFIYILSILVFFTLNGHHLILRVAVMTFDWIPIGGFHIDGRLIEVVGKYFALAFNKGVGWAAPIMGCILIGTFSFGILGKSVPQMNLLIVDLPLRVFVGFAGVAIAIPYVIVLFQNFIAHTGRTYKIIIVLLGGG